MTLTTDFGLEDSYVSQIKGVILSINPKAQIIDLCHNIPPQNIMRAAITIGDSFKYFPKGTIHICVIDPGVGTKRRILCLPTKSGIFLAPNNGLLESVITKEKVKALYFVENKKFFRKEVSQTFHGRDIFAPVAAHLSLGLKPNLLGPKAAEIARLNIPEPLLKKNVLQGEILFVDNFGNLITNITRNTIADYFKPEEINELLIKVGKRTVGTIKQIYSEVKTSRILALFGSSERLEIAANCASASELLLAKPGVRVSLSLQQAED
ncbi:MAG: SAM-dependent chlorinase/fluorinase [Planctomycetota bacterium]